jgi:hypothetical protein
MPGNNKLEDSSATSTSSPSVASMSISDGPAAAAVAAAAAAAATATEAMLACLVDPPPSAGDGDGEFAVLVQSLEEDSVPLTSKVRQEMKRTRSGTWLHGTEAESSYGHPLTADQAVERIGGYGGAIKGGLVHHATLIPDNYVVRGRLMRGLNPRDFEAIPTKGGLPKIKPRRPTLPVTVTELFSSLTKIDGPSGPRYIFYVSCVKAWKARLDRLRTVIV